MNIADTRRWRLLTTGPCRAFHNMALDEALADSVRAEQAPPTLRLYTWGSPSVTLGAFQRSSEVDLSLCAREGIDVVRRPTGGRGILHTPLELTYSFSASTGSGPFSVSLLESYHLLSGAFGRAFSALGLEIRSVSRKRTARTGSPLCFQAASYGEMTVEGKKIIGSAQRRKPGGLLQQGSIPLILDHGLIHRVFGSSGYEDTMAGLREFLPDLQEEALIDALSRGFEKTFGITFERTSLSDGDEARARELIDQKYSRESWNLRR